jgi:hypothetical protein
MQRGQEEDASITDPGYPTPPRAHDHHDTSSAKTVWSDLSRCREYVAALSIFIG